MQLSGRPIAPLQNGMLYHAMTKPGRGVDLEQVIFKLPEAVDFPRFQAAWEDVVARHDILRSSFLWKDGAEPLRVVAPEARLPIHLEDWRDQTPAQQTVNFQSLTARDRLTDFDLTEAPLQRLQLFRLAADHLWGLWTFHHALLDGRSFPLVLREVLDLYDHAVAPQPRPSYDDFVDHLRGLDHEVTRAAWQRRLSGIEPATPLRIGVEVPLSNPPWYGATERSLSVGLSNKLRQTADEAEVSVNNLLQTAWSVLLHRYQSKDDIVFGTTRACRHVTPEAKETIGLLINTVPMRVQVDRQASVRELAWSIRTQQRELRSIETTPLHLIQRWAGLAPGAELFETLVVYDSASLNRRMAADGSAREFHYQGQTNFPITVLGYGDDSILLRLEHALSHLSSAAADRLLDQLVEILTAMSENFDQRVGQVRYLTDADRDCLLRWNETQTDYDLNQTLVDLLERQVARTPTATALRCGDETLSYEQFNQRVNQVAWYLREQGVGPGEVVGVCAHRSLEMLIGIHAIVKAGGAYLPLDPEYPADRLEFMVQDAAATWVIAAGGGATVASVLGCQVLDLDQAETPFLTFPTSNPPAVATPDTVAYVIYTSGSTGLPKGVLNEHRGIVNRLLWMQAALALDTTDVVLQKTPFTFDVSVWELFWPLQTGATLAIAQPGGHRDTRYLASEISRCGVTTLHFVPSMLQLFCEEPLLSECRSIRRVICSGEALAKDLQDRFLERIDVELHNLYGPTEAAIDVTWWACQGDSPLTFVPIGKAIANTTMQVLDRDLQPAPPGAAGELHIGGVQVARGYLNRPELNGQRFIADPQGGADDRLYKTGDLGRFLSDGNIEYLGRTDHQVKIRGFRIELGEIEVVLSSHPAVAHCVVIDREDRPGDRQIVAYYVTATGTTVTEAQLRDFLGQKLADYMVPAAFVAMDVLPLSSAGKVDRKRLPAPSLGRVDSDREPLQNEMERRVAKVWCELLDVPEVGRSTPFFQAGGHSLLAIRLATRLSKEFEREVMITELLDHATVQAQADLLSTAPTENDQLDTVEQVANSRRAAAVRRRQTATVRSRSNR